jgi:hypothetical protein
MLLDRPHAALGDYLSGCIQSCFRAPMICDFSRIHQGRSLIARPN